MQENTPNYYGIIPANVRYSNDVCNGAKLLYCELTALAKQEGYCWATNAYFAKLYNNSNDTISRWISELKTAGFVDVEVDNKAGGLRRIWIIEPKTHRQKDRTPIGKNAAGVRQKDRTPIGKNAAHNNTSIITSTITDKEERTPAFFSKKIDDLKEQTIPQKKERKGRGTLETYLQFVKLSKDEHAQFTEKYGAKFVEDCIEKLDNWIDRQTGAAHEKYLRQNHAACFRSWVIKAVNEDMERAAKRSGSFNGSSNRITSSQAVNLD